MLATAGRACTLATIVRDLCSSATTIIRRDTAVRELCFGSAKHKHGDQARAARPSKQANRAQRVAYTLFKAIVSTVT